MKTKYYHQRMKDPSWREKRRLQARQYRAAKGPGQTADRQVVGVDTSDELCLDLEELLWPQSCEIWLPRTRRLPSAPTTSALTRRLVFNNN